VLEERTVEGVLYVHRFRLIDSNESGAVDLTFTRRDAAQRAVKQAPGGNKVVFVTGFAELTGSVRLGTEEYEVTGRALGSVFTVSLAPAMVAARRLPNAIRVPIGRILRLAQRLLGSRGRRCTSTGPSPDDVVRPALPCPGYRALWDRVSSGVTLVPSYARSAVGKIHDPGAGQRNAGEEQ
jgi:hypothetical protein